MPSDRKTEALEPRSATSPAPPVDGQVEPVPSAARKKETNNARGRGRTFLIFFLVLLVIGAAGLFYWLQERNFESTDDAQIEAHLNPISARVEATITQVYADNNRVVKIGDPLVELDSRDYKAALDQARAQLSQAQSQVIAQRPNIPITQLENTANISTGESAVANAEAALDAASHDRDAAAAKLAEAEANNARAQSDSTRYKILIANEEISQQEYDQVAAAAKAQAAAVDANRAAVASAARTVDQRRAQLSEAQARLAQYQRSAPEQVAIRQANVRSQQSNQLNAQAQVERAQLKLSYCKIAAPVGGIIMNRSAEVGAHIAAGQQLFMIAQLDDLWVTANFKETQLRNIRPNQPATIHVDALDRDFNGYVDTIGAATGAVSSVLPPENASGNFVKVVQRIPVRIRFKPNQSGFDLLRPGMSVEPNVRIRN